MRAFVTGGSGFLGRHLLSTLRARGDEVLALARSDTAAAAVTKAGATPVRGDLDDEAMLQRSMTGCDVVFHAAAHAEDWGDPAVFHRVNVEGTERLLGAARAAGVPRLVHVSTEAVLVGGGPIVNPDESRPRPARPIGLYPQSKAAAEERVLAANTPEFQTIVIRPRFIWGPDDTSILPRIVESVRAGQFRWIGGAHHLTSTCHVANVCEGAILAAERGKGGEIYFLTDGPPVEMRTFMTALLRTRGVEPGDKEIPRWAARAGAWLAEAAWRTLRLKGQPPVTRTAVRLVGEEVTVSDAKARRELGYTGRVSRDEGLAALVSPPAAAQT